MELEQIETHLHEGRGLQAFDEIIRVYNLSETTEHQRDNALKKITCQALLVVAGYKWDEISEIEKLETECLSILGKSNLVSQAPVVGLLFRLLISDFPWVYEGKWRVKIIEFLSNACDQSLFKKDWKINLEGQGYVVIEELKIKTLETIEKYEKDLSMLTSLAVVDRQRTNLMRTMRDKGGTAIFSQFFPYNFNSELDELYTRVDAYINENDNWKLLSVYEHAQEQVQHVSDLLKGYQTTYAARLETGLISKLSALMIDNIQSNEASQPASVRIWVRDKKYPFHIPGNTLRIGLFVQNDGPGYSNDTTITVAGSNFIKITENSNEVKLGNLTPGVVQNFDIPATVINKTNEVKILLEVKWKNFDGQKQEETFEFVLSAQKDDTNWEALSKVVPYSLEPILTSDKLVGRGEIIDNLIRIFTFSSVGSAVVKGQKRVGKTSIARVIQSELEKSGYFIVYSDGGDYVDPTPERTIARLGKRICKEIIRQDTRFKNLPIPQFSDSLSPIADFFDDLEEIVPDKKFVIILDEFDELPVQIYEKNNIGNSFFLTLRTISGRSKIGFLLVGGEKMNHILSYQGAQLNKWSTISVDYFQRDRDWSDYKEMIEGPVIGNIDYSENAINSIFEITCGNPYFTNLICGYIFRIAVERRDCSVTTQEVEDAKFNAINELSANAFQHFWDDGIVEYGDEGAGKLSDRRKIVIAMSNIGENDPPVTLDKLKASKIIHNIPSVEGLLQEFITRNVILLNSQTGHYNFKVPLFSQWLKSHGVSELLTTFSLLNAELRRIEHEESLRVSPSEVKNLVSNWGTYKGKSITSDDVRLWLEQFGKPSKQRVMYKVLQKVYFFSDSVIREKLNELDSLVREGLTRTLARKQRKRGDIIVSYYDHMGKSSSHFAYLFADEAGIYVDNVVAKNDIIDKLSKSDIQAIVFIDDFVGTGESAVKYLKEIDQMLVSALSRNQSGNPTKIVFAVIVANKNGWSKVEKETEKLSTQIILHKCKTLDESDMVFSEHSKVFKSDIDRETARDIALMIGKKLEKDHPLGYGNCELALVFEHTCPNNSLPILWDQSTGKFEWAPLFKRH